MTARNYDERMDNDTPIAGLGTLQLAAIAMHESFVSLMDAGFTEEQALKLVIGMVER